MNKVFIAHNESDAFHPYTLYTVADKDASGQKEMTSASSSSFMT
jgi:hypothetical protein